MPRPKNAPGADDPLRDVPKAEAQAFVRRRVSLEQIAKIVDSMLACSLGMWIFQARDLAGKWIDVSDIDQMRQIRDNPAMSEGRNYRFVALEKPDVRAATLLLAYALDRPAEQVVIDQTIRGDADLVARLREAYKREPKRPESDPMGGKKRPASETGPPSSVH